MDKVKVVLECGDQITANNPPMNGKTTYACPAGLGHGYRLSWIEFQSKGRVTHNRVMQQDHDDRPA